MSVFLDQSAALDGHLNGMGSLPPVAWSNIDYTPVLGTLYLRPTNLRGDTLPATVSTSGTEETNGIYQIDVFAPTGDGKNEALTMADNIAERFKPVQDLTYNSRVVRTLSCSLNDAPDDGGWSHKIVEVRYRSFTTKR